MVKPELSRDGRYKITWEIEVDADTPLEAVKEAQKIQRDRDSLATVFTVKDQDTDKSFLVDLYLDDEDNPVEILG